MKCTKCTAFRKSLYACHICGEKRCGYCSFKRDNGKRVCPGACHILSKSQDVVEYEGDRYKTKKNTPACPDFTLMDSIAVHMWLMAHTVPRGYLSKKENLLTGMGGAIQVNRR